MTQDLPELPEPDFYATDQTDRFNDVIYREGYDADKMRAYGEACAAHAREVALSEAARTCKTLAEVAAVANHGEIARKTSATAESCANAIEQLKASK